MTIRFQRREFEPHDTRAILFDIDGTLVDTDNMLVERIERYLRWPRFILPGFNSHRTARRLVMSLESPTNGILGILDRYGIDQRLSPLLDRIHQIQGTSLLGQARLVQNAQNALDALVVHYPLAIVTAREQRSTESILEEFDLQKFFSCVATARTCRFSKPHPAPVIWAADQLKLEPRGCLMVGDTAVDILAGKRAGAQTVGVLSGFGESAELCAAGADLILDSVAELPEILVHN